MLLINKIKNFKRGFTMIELLVVVVIMVILATIVFVAVSNARAKSIDSFIQQNLKTVQTQAEIYFQKNKTYTVSPNPNINDAASGPCSTAIQYYNMYKHDLVIKRAISDVMKKINNTNPPYTSFCGAGRNSWAVAIRLKSSPRNNDPSDRFWCVDSSPQSKIIPGPPFDISDYNIPPTFKCP